MLLTNFYKTFVKKKRKIVLKVLIRIKIKNKYKLSQLSHFIL